MNLAEQEIARRRRAVTYINLAADYSTSTTGKDTRTDTKKGASSSSSSSGDFNSKHPRAPKGGPDGGQFVKAGTARNAEAGKAQLNKTAENDSMLLQQGKLDPATMSDADLQNLSKYIYSFKSSDAQVVAARIAVANALAKRGMNVNNYGALGPKAPDKPRPAGAPPAGGTRKVEAPKPPPKNPKLDYSKGVDATKLSEAEVDKRIKAGWAGDSNDKSETLYPPKKK